MPHLSLRASRNRFVRVLTLACLSTGLLFVFGLLFVLNRQTNQSSFSAPTIEAKRMSKQAKLNQAFANLPLSFEVNRGQADARAKFLARGSGYNLFLTDTSAVLSLLGGAAPKKVEAQTVDAGARSRPETSGQVKETTQTVLSMELVGANPSPRMQGESELPGKSNYFVDPSPEKWQTDVPLFARVRSSEVYPGIDVVYYGKGRQLEYDFVVAPAADPKQIALRFEGADRLEVSAEGDLVLNLEGRQVRQHKPLIYQEVGGQRKVIEGHYALKDDGRVGFAIGAYDASQPLVIDPVLAYASYLGSAEYEISHGIAVDAAGNAYVTGYAVPPAFPTTAGSVSPTLPNPDDSLLPFVAKFNPAGSVLIYSTYLGGAGEGIAVDAAGNAYTTGYPYPLLFSTTPGALNDEGGVGITKLNPQGNQRVYAARFGSSGTDIPREIAIDAAGNAYVTGTTSCGFPACDFPIVNAAQPNYAGGGDGFVSKLNATGSGLIYSTYVGGGSSEEFYSLDVDNEGNAYTSGYTFSGNYPVTPGAFDSNFNCPNPPFCNPDAFVTKIAANGSAFAYSTYLGGNGSDQGWGIAVDNAGNAYVAGYTDGRFSGFPEEGFPTTPGAFKMFGSVEAFVTKLNTTGSALVYSTLLGGSGSSCAEERARDVDVDAQGNAYVVGMTTCNNFPVADALQPSPASFATEGFITKLNPAGSALVYSSYLGGPRYDEAYHIAVDASGAAFVTGTTSGDFQLITAGAFDTSWNCGQFCEHPDDIFVMKINGQPRPRAKPSDFDGDGKTDISVFRPGNGFWYILNSADGSFRAQQFGASGDVPVAGDYDGDGKADIAVFRQGTWYILNSTNNSLRTEQFGAATDIPVVGDYDADGRDDLAVYRSGTWYVQRSSAGFLAQQFGTGDDQPVASDYDGDGKTDIGVRRPASSTWYIIRSSNGSLLTRNWGTSSDQPIPADYDSDGKSDITVFRPSEGKWYASASSVNNGILTFQFGIAGDVLVPGYYDSDSHVDFAVFRPSSGTWYIRKTTDGTIITQPFGQSGDVAAPAPYVP